MNDGLVRKYLDRIGIEQDRTDAMIGGDDNDDEYTPNLSDLNILNDCVFPWYTLTLIYYYYYYYADLIQQQPKPTTRKRYFWN